MRKALTQSRHTGSATQVLAVIDVIKPMSFSSRGREITRRHQKRQQALTSKLPGTDQERESEKRAGRERRRRRSYAHREGTESGPQGGNNGLAAQGQWPCSIRPSLCSSSALVPAESPPLTLLCHFWPASPNVPDCESCLGL